MAHYRRPAGTSPARALKDGLRRNIIGTSTPHPMMPPSDTMLDKSEHPSMKIPGLKDAMGSN